LKTQLQIWYILRQVAIERMMVREMHPAGLSMDKIERKASCLAVQNCWYFFNHQDELAEPLFKA